MPSYLAAETGTVRKKWKDRLPVALLYPNTYPVAVSNLGFQLVYSLLNQQEAVVCERFVYPDESQPLRSLESSRPLCDFPLVFGSISFEHDYPRLAAMLAAGGVEPLAEQRSQSIGPGHPLVVLGGVGVFMNPEPLAVFADLMVIGEAEPVLLPLLEALKGFAAAGRNSLLLHIGASLPGCYVPAFYAAKNEAINTLLKDYPIDIICLAGFLKLYEPPPALARSVINIHPSLIPSFCGDGFYGSRVHRAVKERGCLVSGCTVHFASEVYDEGPIIVQKSVDLDYDDTPESIAANVFAAECEAFPEALNRVNEKGIDFFWKRVQA